MATRSSKVTVDHDEIRKWAESRGGKPSAVRSTAKGGKPGILRIDFPGYSGEQQLEEISWDQFFEAFEQNNLALVYQDKTAGGKQSNFNKLVDRDSVEIPKTGSRSGRGKRAA